WAPVPWALCRRNQKAIENPKLVPCATSEESLSKRELPNGCFRASTFDLQIALGFRASSFGLFPFLRRCRSGLARIDGRGSIVPAEVSIGNAFDLGGGNRLDFRAGLVDFTPVTFPIIANQMIENWEI